MSFRFARAYNKCYEFHITTLFIWGLICICCSLLILNFELVECWLLMFGLVQYHGHFLKSFCLFFSKSNPVRPFTAWLTVLLMMSWSFGLLYFKCELGERLNNKFEQFNDAVNQCDWYLFPFEVQRMFITMVMNAQQSIRAHGFGNISSSRETFQKVNEEIFQMEENSCSKIEFILRDIIRMIF